MVGDFDHTGTAWVHLKASGMHTQLLCRFTAALYGFVLYYGNPRKTITTALLEFELGICFVLLGYLGATNTRYRWISLGVSWYRKNGHAFSEVGFHFRCSP